MIMDQKAIDFGEFVLEEVGLYAGQNGIVMDQETDSVLQVNGRTVVYPVDESIRVGRDAIPFDPLNNPTLSNYLLSYFITNRTNGYVEGYYTVPTSGNKGIVEIKKEGEVVRSGEYYNDSLKHIDAIARMNGDDEVDLSQYDSENQPRRKRVSKRR